MYLINEFLNWMPAKYWYRGYNLGGHSCDNCGFVYWNLYDSDLTKGYCSYDCLYKLTKSRIIIDRKSNIEIISHTFKTNPVLRLHWLSIKIHADDRRDYYIHGLPWFTDPDDWISG